MEKSIEYFKKGVINLQDRCVCCGEYVPEGRQVCPLCEESCEYHKTLIRTKDKPQKHLEICTMLNEIYARKNHDYGDSFAKLRNEFPNAILVRIYDKYSRLKTLIEGAEQKVKDENIEDTLMDLANYCIMELVERKMENEC